jgi:hypothetical protein
MDAAYRPTRIVERKGLLIVELEDLVLCFIGEELAVRPTVARVLDPRGTPAVEVSGFRHLYSSWPKVAREYETGVALFISEL